MRISDWSSDVCSSDLFPAYRDLAGFDFASSEVNEALVRQLHRCDFIDIADNVVLVGGPGTGKTHVATALGVQAIEHHRKRVRFFSTVELVNALEQEKAQGKTGQIANRRSEEHTSELQSLMRIPYAVFCLKKKNQNADEMINNKWHA